MSFFRSILKCGKPPQTKYKIPSSSGGGKKVVFRSIPNITSSQLLPLEKITGGQLSGGRVKGVFGDETAIKVFQDRGFAGQIIKAFNDPAAVESMRYLAVLRHTVEKNLAYYPLIEFPELKIPKSGTGAELNLEPYSLKLFFARSNSKERTALHLYSAENRTHVIMQAYLGMTRLERDFVARDPVFKKLCGEYLLFRSLILEQTDIRFSELHNLLLNAVAEKNFEIKPPTSCGEGKTLNELFHELGQAYKSYWEYSDQSDRFENWSSRFLSDTEAKFGDACKPMSWLYLNVESGNQPFLYPSLAHFILHTIKEFPPFIKIFSGWVLFNERKAALGSDIKESYLKFLQSEILKLKPTMQKIAKNFMRELLILTPDEASEDPYFAAEEVNLFIESLDHIPS